LADHLNSDDALRELLLSHLKTPPACDIYVTTDQSSGNTVIIFGESYPPTVGVATRIVTPVRDTNQSR